MGNKMTKNKTNAGAAASRASEKKIFDFMLKQSQARVIAALAERKAILNFRERYFNQHPQ